MPSSSLATAPLHPLCKSTTFNDTEYLFAANELDIYLLEFYFV